jgi:hypothetical protein
MQRSFLIAEIALLIFTSLGWIIGYLQHRTLQGKDEIKVRVPLGLFFGLPTANMLSLKGILFQVLMYSIFVLVTIYNLGIITRTGLTYLITLVGVLLATIVGIRYLFFP